MAHASRIEYVTGLGEYAGTDGQGRPWKLSREELILAIETGRMTCYVTFEGHSHLVTLKTDPVGGKQLVTFLGEVDGLPLTQQP
jgi:hypothetical protein